MFDPFSFQQNEPGRFQNRRRTTRENLDGKEAPKPLEGIKLVDSDSIEKSLNRCLRSISREASSPRIRHDPSMQILAALTSPCPFCLLQYGYIRKGYFSWLAAQRVVVTRMDQVATTFTPIALTGSGERTRTAPRRWRRCRASRRTSRARRSSGRWNSD